MNGRLVAAGAFGSAVVMVAAALLANSASAQSERTYAGRQTAVVGRTANGLDTGKGLDSATKSPKVTAAPRVTKRTPAAAPPATGAPPADANVAAAVKLQELELKLGDRTSGTYIDAAGRPVVTVTDSATERVVRRAGLVAKPVTRTRAQLKAAMSTLNNKVPVPGTSWAVDPASNRVVIEVDSTVTPAGLRQVRAAAATLGDTVTMRQMNGKLSTTISGGDAIFGEGGRCSLGFAVTVDNRDAFLTAGHCGNAIRNWFADEQGQTPLGVTVRSSFPDSDFALVLVTSQALPLNGTVRRRDITEAATPVIGQQVVRRGSTTGTRTGNVTALNATVNFPEGTVTGMIRTTVCAEPGDSGGPLFAGSTALGLTSGGSGDCRRGGVTFFQPVTEPLEAFGATVK
jgi:streptogrisin D